MWRLVALAVLLPLAAWAEAPPVHESEQPKPWAVYFTQEDGATQAVVEELGRAKESVRVQAVTLSSPQLTRALLDAHERGVGVSVILNARRSARVASAATLADAGIKTLTDPAHRAAGTNTMVIDDRVIVTGSVGFAPATEGSLLVIHDPALASRYTENWYVHAGHSKRYTTKP
jgi:phosphatidylserine/phosphatidylglycerophosphate/cardiolipin synthase-like enzyme